MLTRIGCTSIVNNFTINNDDSENIFNDYNQNQIFNDSNNDKHLIMIKSKLKHNCRKQQNKNLFNKSINLLRSYYSKNYLSWKTIIYGFVVLSFFIEEAVAGTNCSAADAIRNCVDGLAIPIW